jgi:nitrite reductase (NO-forming)
MAWERKYVFHQHGIPEYRGAMGYFNVSQPMPNLVDGKDIAITKPVSMIDWQENLTKTMQNATTEINEN